MWTRRTFLKAGALATIGAYCGVPRFLTQALAGERSPTSRRPTLVCLFQRGAMDGLMAVPPFRDPGLRALRPRLAMDERDAGGSIVSVDAFGRGRLPDTNDVGLIDLDGRLALHAALAPLAPIFAGGELAIVHGFGSPDPTRSHFDAQDYMETGTPGRKGTESGWLNRATADLAQERATPFQAVAMTAALPRSLYGRRPALAISDLGDFGVSLPAGARPTDLPVGAGFEQLYANATQDLLRGAGRESFEALELIASLDPDAYEPAGGARYPRSKLGQKLRQIAQLTRADVGLEVAFAEMGGWDTHTQQGTRRGTFARQAEELAASIAAFWTDVSADRDDVVVLTMTEFGRTVHENGSGGTDHGRASCAFLIGRRVAGGRVFGSVPALERSQLEDGRDLPVTTDFRAVFAGVLRDHLASSGTHRLFPGWQGEPAGLFRS